MVVVCYWCRRTEAEGGKDMKRSIVGYTCADCRESMKKALRPKK